jgi:hypothetical protein
MAISHVKSNTIADWTGTVTVGNSTGGTQTVNATDLVRPGDWNSAHNQYYTLAGNTNNASTVSGTNVVLSGGTNVTLIGSGATIGISAGNGTAGGWQPIIAGNNSTFSSQGQNSLYMQKVHPDLNYSFNHFEFRISGSFVSSTNSQVVAHTIRYGLYLLDTNQSYNSIATSSMVISASYNSNTAMGFTISQDAASYTTTSAGTAIASLMTGFKHLYLPMTNTMSSDRDYAVGLLVSSATTVGTSPLRIAFLNQTVINNLTVGKVFATTVLASNSTFVGDYAQGVYSATTGAMPAAVAKSQMTMAVSQALLYHQFEG